MEQLRVADRFIESNQAISSADFSQLKYAVQKRVYPKLSATNKFDLWSVKIDNAINNETKMAKVVYLKEVKSFIRDIFSEKLTKNDMLTTAKALESKGFKLFKSDEIISIVGSPAYVSLNSNAIITPQYMRPPATGLCHCAVSSDYCNSGYSCISPTKSCDDGSDNFCGFLLLYDCNGICINAGVE